MNAFVIFMLIGVSHWISHVMSCKGCRHNVAGVLLFFGHGIVQTLGWPFFAIEYIVGMFRKEEPLTDEERRLIEFHRRNRDKIKAGVEAMKRELGSEGMPKFINSIDDLPDDMPEPMKEKLRDLFKTMDEINRKGDGGK